MLEVLKRLKRSEGIERQFRRNVIIQETIDVRIYDGVPTMEWSIMSSTRTLVFIPVSERLTVLVIELRILVQ